jgi:hypothetical protein
MTSLATSLGFGSKKEVKPKVKKLTKPDEVTDEETMIQSIIYIDAGLAYSGFSPVKTRAVVAESMDPYGLLQMLTLYRAVGNGAEARISAKKTVDTSVGSDVLKLMKDLKIRSKAAGSDELTLPRMAQSFPAVIIWLSLKCPHTPRLVTSSPAHLQDLCLSAYTKTPAATGAQDFVEKFSVVLEEAKAKKDKTTFSKEDCLKKLAMYQQLGEMGLEADPVGKAAMAVVVPASESLKELFKRYGWELSF